MILYVNGCARETSRTNRLARALLQKYGGEVAELRLFEENLVPLSAESIALRDERICNGDFSNPSFRYARQFAEADEIVIASPYWDLSFCAELKIYLENICVMGIASCYDENGIPQGLCKAKRLSYVTTAGGTYLPDFSYGLISALAKNYFGIPETCLVFAENLDIAGNDAEKILAEAIARL